MASCRTIIAALLRYFYQNAVTDTSWVQAATSVIGSVPTSGSIVTFKGALYLLLPGSGVNGGKVWSSYDALTWTSITTSAAPSGAVIQLAVLGSKMYAATMNNNSAGTNAVWSSPDGITWTATTTNPAWEASNDLLNFRMTSAQGRLWVCGGYGNTAAALRNKVWYSADGVTWTQATATAPFSARHRGCLFSINNTLLVYVGGRIATAPTYDDDVWISSDGATWTQQQTTTVGATFFTDAATFSSPGFVMSDGTIIVTGPSTGISPSGGWQYGYVTPTGTSSTAISSTVSVIPTGFADFATDYTRSQVMVRCDAASYKFNPTGSTLTAISDVDFPALTVRGCCYLDGTFYVMDANGTIYGSDIDNCTSWNALNFVSAEANPDQGVFLAKVQKYIVALKSQSCQYFWDAANATGSPLSPVDNGTILIGCAHGFSVQQMENTVIFMAQRKAVGTSFQKGRFIATMSDQLGYQVTSTPDVDRVLNADDLATIYSCTSAENGHNFYHLYLGTSGVTLTYDMQTGIWDVWERATATSAKSVSALTQANGTATATSTAHGFADGDEITIAGASPSGYNGTFNITYVDANTFTYLVSSALSSPATGTITATGSTPGQFDMVASCSYDGTQVFQDLSYRLDLADARREHAGQLREHRLQVPHAQARLRLDLPEVPLHDDLLRAPAHGLDGQGAAPLHGRRLPDLQQLPAVRCHGCLLELAQVWQLQKARVGVAIHRRAEALR